MNWNLLPEQYNKMAVHEPIHPNYDDFRAVVKELNLACGEFGTDKTRVSFPNVFEFA